MNIQKLYLKGAIGIWKAQGLDEISIDFSQMTGLIAIAGPTGAGKTAILESLHPFPQVFSRDKPAIKNQFRLKDSIKQLDFLHNGDHWRTLIKIDAETGGVEGFIYINGSEESLTDGKITNYKKIIKKEFGSVDLFLNSVFSRQNGTKMSDMQAADLKNLVSEFCGKRLEKLKAHEENTKASVKELSKKIDAVDVSLQRENETILQYADAKTKLVTAETALKETNGARVEAEGKVQAGQKALPDMVSVARMQEDIQNQIDEKEGEIAKLEEHSKKVTSDTAADRAVIEESISENRKAIETQETILKDKDAIEGAELEETRLSDGLDSWKSDHNDSYHSYETFVAGLDKAKAEDVKAGNLYNDARHKNVDEYQKLKDDLQAKTNTIESHQRKVDAFSNDPQLEKLDLHLRHAGPMAAGLETRGTITIEEIIHDIEPKTVIHSIPCNSEDCPYVAQALQAKKDIPLLEAQIKEIQDKNLESVKSLQDSIEEHTTEKDTIRGRMEASQARGTDRNEAHTKAQATRNAEIERLSFIIGLIMSDGERLKLKIREIEAEIEKCKELSARKPLIQIADERLIDLKSKRDDLSADIKNLEEDFQKLLDANCRRGLEILSAITPLKDKLDPGIEDKITELNKGMEFFGRQVSNLDRESKGIEADIVRLEENVKTADTAAKSVKEFTDRRKMLSIKHAAWLYVQNKCGKDGIQALEINSVAPSIVESANALLEKAFGPAARVDIKTLDADGKEILELVCIDNEGEEVPIKNRSGGEQRYGMLPMRLAMAALSRRKSGINLQTMFLDEADDGLSEEAAISYTNLYRAFQDLHGFQKIFFISHKAFCINLADHVIELGPGGIQT